LSPYMVREVLRKELKFAGATITDDMDMGAIAKTYGSADAAAQALAAGNDIMLVCHNIEGVPAIAAALKKVAPEFQEEAYGRIQGIRQRLAEPAKFSMEMFQKLDEGVAKLREATLGELTATSR
jgi:beta-N-acetylhexosaminidase